jgi:hypothetical protein
MKGAVSILKEIRKHANLPLKCCRSLISRSARFARIFLLKTFVTFLIATPSPDPEFDAALEQHEYPIWLAGPEIIAHQTMP